MSETALSTAQLLTVMIWALLMSIPFELPIIVAALVSGVGTEKALAWLDAPTLNLRSLLLLVGLVVVPLPFALVLEALSARAMGRIAPGVIDRWSLSYVRVWIKALIVDSASQWLSGTLFWPVWLRLAGMSIGRGCEISTIIDIVPELTSIGETTFFADGIYLGGPRIHRGTVSLAMTSLGTNTFLGNHAVIVSGHKLPSDILLGVCTVSDDKIIREGSSWFGQPPFELPKREIVECDRSLTHEPSFIRFWNRIFWETSRFVLPGVFALVFSIWYDWANRIEPYFSPAGFVLLGLPLLNLTIPVFLCAFVLALKWILLGKVKPAIHPLWSCWCCRWDFLFVAWGVLAYASLSVLQGTIFLVWYLRLMGMKIGKGVAMGEGFAQVVDPDMLHFEDGATVTCQFQAHTFEDRVLKIDHVRIGPRSNVGHSAVLLYGADIGEETYVIPHSVVMKKEHLLPGRVYAGSPTKPV